MSYQKIKHILSQYAGMNDTQRFFKKTDSDHFSGIPMPVLRKIAKEYESDINPKDWITSPINEERMLALIVLCKNFKKDPINTYEFYIRNLQYINNWNLVDVSAPIIMGGYLENKDNQILLDLARSSILWERRIAIVTTLYFIKKKQFEWTFQLAKILLNDQEDLVQKAVGWMLREVGEKGGEKELINFLNKYAAFMPRTMLRYSIEKFETPVKKNFLAKKK